MTNKQLVWQTMIELYNRGLSVSRKNLLEELMPNNRITYFGIENSINKLKREGFIRSSETRQFFILLRTEGAKPT